jgi:osmotically-inducible protein OsmY
MKRNEDLQRDVQDAIRWEPLLSAAEIGVTAKDGVITLTGIVDSYAKKLEAEDAAKKVAGVRAIAQEIEIRFANSNKKNDAEVATEIVTALTSNFEIPENLVQVKVENGFVTLEGELSWNYQKEAAKRVVNHLVGVKGVTNNIRIKSEFADQIEKVEIEKALFRNRTVDSEDIHVEVSGNKVTLNGTVTSFYERGEAERMAWNAPGVSKVDNELLIDYAGF